MNSDFKIKILVILLAAKYLPVEQCRAADPVGPTWPVISAIDGLGQAIDVSDLYAICMHSNSIQTVYAKISVPIDRSASAWQRAAQQRLQIR